MYYNLSLIVLLGFGTIHCLEKVDSSKQEPEGQSLSEGAAIPAADHMNEYLGLLRNLKVALVVNQTSRVGETHLVDTLLTQQIEIECIFSPEHGFRGDEDAGSHIEDKIDSETGKPIISLYGEKRKPSGSDLDGIDLVLFDIQDVGARFYTYISTMHYVMEACAESKVPFVVLDRPNPNGHYVDGPMRENEFRSFVGMHPVPVVYGMTIGEYARMINGEGWLENGVRCDLTVIPCQQYQHDDFYELPVAPSPNLPNIRSVLLYPSLCFFEGTVMSIGRGTDKQFQVIGHPTGSIGSDQFTPLPRYGAAKPKLQGQLCKGVDLTVLTPQSIKAEGQINLDYLIENFQAFPDKEVFFNAKWFDKLAGTTTLRKAIIAGKTAAEIRARWKSDLDTFKQVRAKYLLYQ